MRFSSLELQHLFRAWLVISVAFAILLSGGFSFSIGFLAAVVMAAITVGLGFLLHEMAHKFLAQRYGCIAEFRAFDTMLLLALLMSFFGFILAAPGAVFIHGNVNKARNGRISAIGPLMNIALALVFFVMLLLVKAAYPVPILITLSYYGLSINGWLALFNMLPFWHLDGKKVLQWNRKIYALMVAAAILAMMLPALAGFGG
jgi:Zn-dependent protease